MPIQLTHNEYSERLASLGLIEAIDEYKGRKVKIRHRCLRHGNIETLSPEVALRGKQLSCCKKPVTKKKTTEEFVIESKNKWGERFDYSKTNYINRKTKLIIGCSIHGFIEVCPDTHLSGRKGNQGCPKCGNEINVKKRELARESSRLTLEKVRERGEKIFGFKFTYTEVIPSTKESNAKVKYICPYHGEQTQDIANHLRNVSTNYGCISCFREQDSKQKRIPAAIIKEEAILVHQNKYDYSLVDFTKGIKDRAKIICPIEGHGIFEQELSMHIREGQGCPKCAGVALKTNEEFIADAIKMHGNFYDYSKSQYINARTKLKIICPLHGSFEQEPAQHTNRGRGCPLCGERNRGRDSIFNFSNDIEFASIETELYLVELYGLLKIGIAVDTQKRSSKYEEILFQRSAMRVVSWCVEQKLLNETMFAIPKAIPKELLEFGGKSELRDKEKIDVYELADEMDKELDYCESIGWESYALENSLKNYGHQNHF